MVRCITIFARTLSQSDPIFLLDNIFYETGPNMAIAFALQDYRSGNSSWKSQVLGNTLQLYEDNRNTSGMYNEASTPKQIK